MFIVSISIDTYSFPEVKEIIHKHIEEKGSKDGSLRYPFYDRQSHEEELVTYVKSP